ncbi:MAG: sigma-70 family RNA polymerase sigma factor [Phycisphaerae bacterium]|nr:sigma-70 family RNA polymerase sigma factor [Phycisphaerae bacterium]
MPDVGSDQKLVERCRRGDGRAYEELVVRHYRSVYALCLGIMANTEDAGDLSQESFLAGFQKIRALRETDRFGHWILQIARNLCIDTIRKRRALAKHQADYRPTRQDESPHPSIDILWAVETLPEDLRIPLLMFYFDGKDADGIAEALHISKSNLYQRMRSARARLYELLVEKS